MPTYNYKCTKCGHTFEQFVHRIAYQKEPESEPCPKCSENDSVKHTFVPVIMSVSHISEVGAAVKKLNDGSAFKEKLQQIHDNTPGSKLNHSSNLVEIK